jgi:hypothetical protein
MNPARRRTGCAGRSTRSQNRHQRLRIESSYAASRAKFMAPIVINNYFILL